MIRLLLLIMVVSTAAHADEFWDEACLKRELTPCGKTVLPRDPNKPLTEKQQEVFLCRIKALSKCRKHNNEN